MRTIDYKIEHLGNTTGVKPTWRWAKSIIFESLKKVETGYLVVEDIDNTYEFGEYCENSPYIARVHISNPQTYIKVLFSGVIGVGEAYTMGWWKSDNLTSVIRLFVTNQNVMNRMQNPLSFLLRKFGSIFQHLFPNTIAKAKRNIVGHYDLSNEFFSLFLDSSMMYSSGIYKHPSDTLEQASRNKLERICQCLRLNVDDHLLEIGSGWGGLAIYAAKNYGCRVTTTTISDAQYEYAIKAVKNAGLQNRITVLNTDYRLLEGEFDKLVSIEMIEAIGYKQYKQYFQHCGLRLKDGGLMLIQCITTPDERFAKQKNEIDFIRKYIFPGGCLPSIQALVDTSMQSSCLKLIDQKDITLSYAATLRDWRRNFFRNVDEVLKLGFSESFIRLWEFYLCYCEGGFSDRAIGTSQLLFSKAKCNADIDCSDARN